jgi:dTDP-4-amino-4,6-dideoxy-D-galactose acyltransferase
VSGADRFALLDWDSQFFGVKVGSIQQEKLDDADAHAAAEWARENRVDWLYFLADAQDPETIQAAQRARFQYVGDRLELGRRLRGPLREALPDPEGIAFREAKHTDVADLRSIAESAYEQSRFFFDAHVDRSKARELYGVWIERSVVDAYADWVIVADSAAGPCGYITGKRVVNGTGSIGLVGVSAGVRGQGVGAQLVERAVDRFAAQNFEQVVVVTQGSNVFAQRLYQRCGFLSQSVKSWFHKWYR